MSPKPSAGITAAPTADANATAAASPVTALLEALRAEAQIVEGLIEILRRQREGVAADDIRAIDRTVEATESLISWLHTVHGERTLFCDQIVGHENATMSEVLTILGPKIDASLAEAADALQQAATTLEQETSANRMMLEAASKNTDESIRGLYGGQRPTATAIVPDRAGTPTQYGPSMPSRGPGGALVDLSG